MVNVGSVAKRTGYGNSVGGNGSNSPAGVTMKSFGRRIQACSNVIQVEGNYDNWFDDVTVVASGGIKQSRVEDIYPFTLSSAVNYEPKFMLGWKSEVYAKDVKQGFAVAENIMDQFIEKEIIKQIPGDTYRFLQINTRKSDITFKHLLLPIWVAAYQYGNKTYQVVVNGETGKISGEKPLSWIKITLAVLAVAIVAFAIYYFTKHK